MKYLSFVLKYYRRIWSMRQRIHRQNFQQYFTYSLLFKCLPI